MRVAVGGGRGFIGSVVASRLASVGHEVAVFGAEGASALGRADALVWAGGRREEDEAALRRAHVDAPLAAAAALGPRVIVYLSSGEVYGPVAVPFREDVGGEAPVSGYGRAKLAGEAALATGGAALFVLRPGVVYGPGQAPRMLVPRVLESLRAGRPMPLTSGEQTRDLVHVDDLAALVERCLADGAPPGTYNAGSGRETRVRDVCLMLAAGFGPGHAELLRFGEVPLRAGEQLRYVLAVDKAARHLAWRAQIRLEDGLAALVRA